MDKQPFMNRMSIVLTYKQPFNDWINSLKSQSNTAESFHGVYSSYLIADASRAYKTLIRRYFKKIFRNELSHFTYNRDLWPENLTFELFNEWFSVSVADWVYDMGYQDAAHEEAQAEFELWNTCLQTSVNAYV